MGIVQKREVVQVYTILKVSSYCTFAILCQVLVLLIWNIV